MGISLVQSRTDLRVFNIVQVPTGDVLRTATKEFYLKHDWSSPERQWEAATIDNFACRQWRQELDHSAAQPWQDQPQLDHPVTVVFAMVDWMNNLPVAVERYDDNGHHSSVTSKSNQDCWMNHFAQELVSWVWGIEMSKHSIQV